MILIFYSLVAILAVSIFITKMLKVKRAKEHKKARFTSLPSHYSYCFTMWCLIACSGLYFTTFSLLIKSTLTISIIIVNMILIRFSYYKNFNAKKHIEVAQIGFLSITAGIGILITLIITASILIEALKFFKLISPLDFFFGKTWNPQMATTSEQEVSKGAFGILPVFLGTALVTIIAMIIAVPIGIMSAIYLSMYAKTQTRDYLKPILEILAGVPTVVYGYFAVVVIAPLFKKVFTLLGFNISSESALSAGFVMGIMIIPFILSLTDDAISSVPQSLKDGALALGSTKSEMIKKVVLPSAMPSIVSAIILAVSRAIGETMIVVMAAGLVANLTFNPLNSVTTATAQIVTLLVGDQEFNSPKTLSAFALALTLFALTFVFNVVALIVIKNFKKKYT